MKLRIFKTFVVGHEDPIEGEDDDPVDKHIKKEYDLTMTALKSDDMSVLFMFRVTNMEQRRRLPGFRRLSDVEDEG